MADVERDVLDSPAAGRLVIRGGALRALGYLLATGMSVLSYALITRHLGVGRFGDYQTALSIVTVIGTITDAGMTTLAVREYATLAGEARTGLMRNLLGARLGLSAIGVAIALAVAAGLGFDAALVAGTALAAVGIGVNGLQSMLAVPLMASLRLGIATALDVGRQVVLVALLVAAVVAGTGVLWLLAATVPAAIAGVVATAAVLQDRRPLRPTLHPSEWRRLLTLTLPVALTMAAGSIYLYLVQVLTNTVASDEQSGLFSASFRVFLVVGAIPGLVVSTAFPLLARAARDDQERLAYSIDRLFRTSVLFGCLLCVTLAAGASVAIDVLAGPAFRDAIPVLRVQALALLGTFSVATLSFALLTLRLHRAIMVVNLVALAVTAAVSLLVVPGHGAQAAAWSSVAGEGTLGLMSYLVLRRSRPDLAPGASAVLRVLPPAGAAAAVGLALGLPGLVAAIVAGLVFIVVALLVRAVPEELLEVVRARLR